MPATGRAAGPGLDTLVGAAADALAAVHAADLGAAHDSEVREAVMALEAVRAQAEAACARLVGELDARRLWADDGARNGQAWLRTTGRVERGRASRLVRHGQDRPFKVSAQRTFRDALRRAVKVRDRECTHPCCDAPADRCEVDHVQPSAWNGPTSVENGRLRCPFHNRGRHGHRGPPDEDPPPG